MRRPVVLAIVVPTLLVGVLVWLVSQRTAAAQRAAGGSGTVEGTETFVTAKVVGRLQEVRVREGDRVRRGDVLAKLDCRENEATLAAAKARTIGARAQVKVAEQGIVSARDSAAVAVAQVGAAKARAEALNEDLAQAKRDLDRAQTLVAAGVAPDVDRERIDSRKGALEHQFSSSSAETQTTQLRARAARNAVDLEEARLESARAAVLTAEADEQRAALSVDECTLSAPTDGVVTQRLLEPGTVVGIGTRVITILDLSTIKVVFYLPNAHLAEAQVGAPADIRVDAYPGRVFTGTISKIASEAEFTPRNVQTREDRDRLVFAVEVQVANAGQELRAGMPAEVQLRPGAAPVARPNTTAPLTGASR